MAKDAVLVERNSSLALKVGFDARTLSDCLAMGDEMRGSQDRVEPVKKFWNPLFTERFCPAQCFGFLILIVKTDADRMVRIVCFGNNIGDGQLELMRPKLPLPGLRS